MAYPLTTSSGAPVATIQDATINTSATSLTLIGRDYAGYGQFLNENLIYLTEHWANDTAPANPLTGQLWYNTSLNTLEVYNSTLGIWKVISSSIVSPTQPPPGESTTGDIWWNTSTNQLFVWNGSAWTLIGPPTTSSGSVTGPIVETILDTTSQPHLAINFIIANQIVGIISYDPTYTPYTAINGFDTINPGFNLSSLNGNQFTGSATNAMALNGITSSQFLRSDQNTNTPYQLTSGAGFVVASDLNIALDAANNQVILNSLTNGRNFNIYTNVNGQQTKSIGINGTTGTVSFANAVTVSGSLTSTGALTVASTTNLQGVTTLQNALVPAVTNTISIGNASAQFNSVWATTIYGNLVTNSLTTSGFKVNGNLTVANTATFSGNVLVANVYTPSSSTGGNTSPGTTGQITYDTNYIYICVAPNTWKRANIALW
jgi:hypothetical protein